MKSVAVVTSTIGRPELERAIISVQQQIYPCKHYVFVDGKDYIDNVKPLEKKYPNVDFIYLPQSTGKDGWTNSYINAMSAFIVKEDIVCFLDDDNWYDPNHTFVITNAFERYQVGVAFTLRRMFEHSTQHPLGNDELESIGFWKFQGDQLKYSFTFNQCTRELSSRFPQGFLVDTNCLALSLEIARQFSYHWVQHKKNDRYLFNTLLNSKIPSVSTGLVTVNYMVDLYKISTLAPRVLETFKVDINNNEEVFEFKCQLFTELRKTSGEKLNYIFYQPHLLNENGLQCLTNEDFSQ